MTPHNWSRRELLELARGGRLTALDGAAGVAEPPDWLRSVVSEELTSDPSEAVERFHPDDRGGLIDLYLSSIDEPGVLRTRRFRANIDDEWGHLEISVVNLLEDPAVGCVLLVSRDVEGQTIPDPDLDLGAGHATTNWMLLTLNGSGFITSVEGNAQALLGYQPSELIGQAPTSLIHPDHLVDSIRLWRALVEQPIDTRTSQRRWIRKGGEQIWIESSYVNRGDDFPPEERYLVVMWDITERRAAERALREREAELVRMADDFRSLADEVPAAVLRCTVNGSVVFHNSRWVELLEGRSGVERLHDLFDSASGELLDAALSAGRETTDPDSTTVELHSNDGTTWRLTLRPLAATGDQPGDYIGSLQDISQTVRLREEATHDSLTGLFNRPAIEAEIVEILAGEHDAIVAFIDLDGFKAVNDTWGHDAGDVVLNEVAQRLGNAVRSIDAVGRWGGDEFVVVFRDATSEADETVLATLGQAFVDPVDFGAGVWIPSASIGLARLQAGDDVDAIIGRADQAMLDHKRLRPDRSR